MKKKVILALLDGWGLAAPDKFNAIDNANTPNLDMLMAEYPWCKTLTDGPNVGLPAGEVGTSETNHLVIGSGCIPKQDLYKVDAAIEDGTFFSNPQLRNILAHVEKNKSALHVSGILSDGGVHSHTRHYWALFQHLQKINFKQPVYLHLFPDGRDTAPLSAERYFSEMDSQIRNLPNVRLASLQGRYYLDRDKDWSKTEAACQLILNAQGEHMPDWQSAVKSAYSKMTEGLNNDQYLRQYVIGEPTKINPGDGFLFMHFRADRAYQLLKRMLDAKVSDLYITSLFKPSADFDYQPFFISDEVTTSLAEIISRHGLRQAHISETEKHVHITYYFNGRQEKELPGEHWEILESNRSVKPFYNLDPAMRVHEYTDLVLKHITADDCDFMFVNFTNADMVGHTGSYEAAVCAAEAVDFSIGRVYQAIKDRLSKDYALVICADHGNSETMWDHKTNQPHTSHTFNPTPLIIVDPSVKQLRCEVTQLCDIAPSVLKLMGLPQPDEMTGKALF